jgi:hypothetical protein
VAGSAALGEALEDGYAFFGLLVGELAGAVAVGCGATEGAPALVGAGFCGWGVVVGAVCCDC